MTMYAVATIFWCSAFMGCSNTLANAEWVTADTRYECEMLNMDRLTEYVEKAGDKIDKARVLCKRVGV